MLSDTLTINSELIKINIYQVGGPKVPEPHLRSQILICGFLTTKYYVYMWEIHCRIDGLSCGNVFCLGSCFFSLYTGATIPLLQCCGVEYVTKQKYMNGFRAKSYG